MIFGCSTFISGKIINKNVCCDIYLHADAKSGNYAQKIINILSKQIIEFFENVENDLCRKNELTKEINYLISLNKEKIIGSSEFNNMKQKILSIFRKN